MDSSQPHSGVRPASARSPKMAELVAADIRSRITQGELADGSTLPLESELMEHYQVSRPTLREAMRILEAESLITPRRGSREGARVSAPSSVVASRYAALLLQYRGATYGDLYAMRLILEPPAAARMAAGKSADALAALKQALAVEEGVLDDTEAFFRASARFHERVVELAGLAPLSLFVEMIGELLEQQHAGPSEKTSSAATLRLRARAAHRAHREFVEILEAGSAAEAERFWRSHLDAIGEHYDKGSPVAVVLPEF